MARRAGTTSSVDPRTDRRLTFGGRASATVPPGAPLLSDPVALSVAADSDLVVSVHLPRRTPATTVHAFPYQDGYAAAGNVTGSADITPTEVLGKWYFLTGVSVTGGRDSTVVAFGDSITDGAETTRGADRRWPDVLARRFQADRDLRHLGVVNSGISGNRLLHDPNPPAGSPAEGYANYFGQAALRRFDRDVLARPGASHVIVLLGVNDLGHPGTSAPESERVSAQDVIDGHRRLIARAHAHGLLVHGGTITPFKDDTFGFYSPENEAARQTVNRWIRTSGEYDLSLIHQTCTRTTRAWRHWRRRSRCACSAEDRCGVTSRRPRSPRTARTYSTGSASTVRSASSVSRTISASDPSSWSSHRVIPTPNAVTPACAARVAVRSSTPRSRKPSRIAFDSAESFHSSRSRSPASVWITERRVRMYSRCPSNTPSAIVRNPCRITAIGPSDGGASAIIFATSAGNSSSPTNSTSRLSAKCRKNVRVVSPARAVICGTVVSANPCSTNRSTAARLSRSRASGSHLPTRPS